MFTHTGSKLFFALLIALVLSAGSAGDARAADVTVPAGTNLLVRTRGAIDSNRMGQGAKFTVSLESDLRVGEVIVAPDGSSAYGIITNTRRDANVVGTSELTVTLTELKVQGRLIPVRTSGVRAVGESKGRRTARKAAAGAAIGAVFGGGRGAAMGAGAAAASQLLLGGRQVSIPANTLLEFTLADAVSVEKSGPSAAATPEENTPSGEAGDAAMLALNVAKVRSANEQAIRSYGWKQRTELRHSGEPLLVRLELLRFDIDGNLQRTTMSEDPNRAGDKQAYLKEVYGLRSYGLPTSGRLLDFMQKAKITEDKDTVVATSKNVLTIGDEVTMSIDKKSNEIRQIQASVPVDGVPYAATIDYRKVEGELNQPARAVVQIPSKDVEIRIENFGYQKQ